ncbi:MAG TPA: PEGA domain-containing protein [Kofleriaceae bacterium]
MLVCLAIPVSLRSMAHAQPAAPASSEAAKHFQRGVTMYNEADYRAALVEFRRAYETAPNAAVLYNIGQTYYQLQNYAAALVALGRYLTEAGPTAPHRREVEQTIDTLQTRVGKVAISTSTPGADVTVDDELVGKTPLEEPVLVSIGRRKITALRDGRVTETRFVDVAAGDTVTVSLAADARTPPPGTPEPGPRGPSPGMITTGWVVTGIAGAAAVGLGGYAWLASRDLSSARNSNPVSSDAATAKQNDLASKSSKVSTFSHIADAAGAVAVIAGGVTLYLSLSRSKEHETRVAITPNGIQIAGTFR